MSIHDAKLVVKGAYLEDNARLMEVIKLKVVPRQNNTPSWVEVTLEDAKTFTIGKYKMTEVVKEFNLVRSPAEDSAAADRVASGGP